MKLTPKYALAAIVLVLCFAAPVTAGPLEDGDDAILRGDYATALKLVRPLADKGDVRAQVFLYRMYEKGAGTILDHATALKYLLSAAEQGNLWSQMKVSVDYIEAKDHFQSYKWSTIVAARKDVPDKFRPLIETSQNLLRSVAKVLSPSQIAEANRQANEYFERASEVNKLALGNIVITKWNGHKEAYGSVLIATFTFQNKNEFDVKDIEVTCEHSAKSGTMIDKNTRIIYEIVKAVSSKTVRNFNMGFINSQAISSSCKITGFMSLLTCYPGC